MSLSAVNISSPSVFLSRNEGEYGSKVLSLISKLGEVRQGSAELIINFKSKEFSSSDKTHLINESKSKLDMLANGIALIKSHEFSMQEYKNAETYIPALNTMLNSLKTSYDELRVLSKTCVTSLPADANFVEAATQEPIVSKTDAGKGSKSVSFVWWTK